MEYLMRGGLGGRGSMMNHDERLIKPDEKLVEWLLVMEEDFSFL